MIANLASGLGVQQPFLDLYAANKFAAVGKWEVYSLQNLAVGTAGIEFRFVSTGLMYVYRYSQNAGVVITDTTYGGWSDPVSSTQAGLYEVNVTEISNTQGAGVGVTTTTYTMGTWAALSTTRWFKYAAPHTVLGTYIGEFNIKIRRTTDTREMFSKNVILEVTIA